MKLTRTVFLIALAALSAASFFPSSLSEGRRHLLASAPARTVHSQLPSAQNCVVSEPVPVYGYKIIKTYPHDRNAFTQGLIFHDGFLYESTGLYQRSTLRKVELDTGKVLQQYPLLDIFFGEGLTLWEDRLIQLTWLERKGFVYERESFQPIREFGYPAEIREGWGLTHDGARLILSDGTANLSFLDPETFERIGKVTVCDAGTPRNLLNELEYIQGLIYANVWHSDRIAMIAPETGQIVGWIDLSGLLLAEERVSQDAVLNGIAYDAKCGRLFVTGKWWPKLFHIESVPKG